LVSVRPAEINNQVTGYGFCDLANVVGLETLDVFPQN
jgi:hypothetical protein